MSRELILASAKTSKHGIIRADRYFREIEGCLNGGLCPTKLYGDHPPGDWQKELAAAEGKLTYSHPDMDIKDVGIAGLSLSHGSIMDFDCVITTTTRDRDGDVLETKGASFDLRMPLLWQHIPMAPIGKMVSLISHTDNEARGRFAIADIAQGRDAAALIDMGALRISHGFMPEEDGYEPLKGTDGWHITKFKVFEASTVSVPSNVDAVITVFSRGKLHDPLIKQWAKSYFDNRIKTFAFSPQRLVELDDKFNRLSTSVAELAPKTQPPETFTTTVLTPKAACSCGTKNHAPAEEPEETTERPERQLPATDDATGITEYPVDKSAPRWNLKLSARFNRKQFDTNNEYLEASKLEYEWVAKHCNCQVKDLFKNTTDIPSARMGSFLTGVQRVCVNDKVQDVRNITHEGRENPPAYEVIELTSERNASFLIEGMQFYVGPDGPFVVKYTPTWTGIYMTVYTSLKNEAKNRAVIEKSWEWAKVNNFLKGEAFSLSGEFLPRDELSFEDVFLDGKQQTPIERMLKNLNEKQGRAANRGMVFMGPPGTGKTLSARVVKNQAEASFIWISARDLYYFSPYGGIRYAYSLAKELAPCVIVMEDIDNWFYDDTIDLLKAEMDGVGRSSGVITILTTNFPERLPEALLDRPGRFHDVLKFDCPDEKVRERMLSKWLPDLPDAERKTVVAETDGMSGAHLFELSEYAKSISEQDEIEISPAVKQALEKVREQRELINEQWAGASRHRPRKELADFVMKSRPEFAVVKDSGKMMKCPECGHQGTMAQFDNADKSAASYTAIAAQFLYGAVKNAGIAKRIIESASRQIDDAELESELLSLV
jgi:DNA polymerase III delta prime subunit